MNIIKLYILLLLIFVTKTNCGTYNHLDLQLVLLILSSGDNNKGNIIKDVDGNYLKINISAKNPIYKNFIEIVPELHIF